MKKALNVTLAILAAFSLASCGADSEDDDAEDNGEAPEEVTPAPSSDPMPGDTASYEDMDGE